MYNPLKNCVKSSVLNTIFDAAPITAKKIYFKIKKEHLVSYQYVHKLLTQLTEEEILIKESLEYKVNPSWVIALKSRFENGLKN